MPPLHKCRNSRLQKVDSSTRSHDYVLTPDDLPVSRHAHLGRDLRGAYFLPGELRFLLVSKPSHTSPVSLERETCSVSLMPQLVFDHLCRMAHARSTPTGTPRSDAQRVLRSQEGGRNGERVSTDGNTTREKKEQEKRSEREVALPEIVYWIFSSSISNSRAAFDGMPQAGKPRSP